MAMTHRSRSVALAVALALQSLWAVPISAGGPYADELSRCLVRTTTSADKSVLVQWMFATAALHPDVKWMISIDEPQRVDVNRRTARLFEDLLTRSCLPEARQALKYEGRSAIDASFNVLGQVAARELLTHPKVTAGLAELDKYIDSKQLQKTLESEK